MDRVPAVFMGLNGSLSEYCPHLNISLVSYCSVGYSDFDTLGKIATPDKIFKSAKLILIIFQKKNIFLHFEQFLPENRVLCQKRPFREASLFNEPHWTIKTRVFL
jgi:hypothetical protein